MPVIDSAALQTLKENPIRVLVTGFGPFSRYPENPSWLAVKPLHNTVLDIDILAEPVVYDDQIVVEQTDGDGQTPRQIHITTLEIPVTYEGVLAATPGLHARPPVLPTSLDPLYPTIPPPGDGYDLIFHVGVAGRGPLRMERQGHKLGYNMKDANGCLAPLVRIASDDAKRRPVEPSEAERIERARLGEYALETTTDGGELPKRGFGKGYENFPEEIYTDIDVEKLVQHLKKEGIEQIYTSMDAGHYLCDFIYYCSLAEGKRTSMKHDKASKVLFLHCPPVGQPLCTEEVTDAIKRIVVWVCSNSL